MKTEQLELFGRREPAQQPGRSRQNYETPVEFLAAVEMRWGKLEFDLAATPENAKAPHYLTPADDALAEDWPCDLRMWLNPPFGRIAPWAAKCSRMHLTPTARIFLLVPASIGSTWFSEHVHDKARVLALQPRLSFDGKNPFPKDCMLCVYGEPPGFEVWRWK